VPANPLVSPERGQARRLFHEPGGLASRKQVRRRKPSCRRPARGFFLGAVRECRMFRAEHTHFNTTKSITLVGIRLGSKRMAGTLARCSLAMSTLPYAATYLSAIGYVIRTPKVLTLPGERGSLFLQRTLQ
jgi:hypothetical protein